MATEDEMEYEDSEIRFSDYHTSVFYEVARMSNIRPDIVKTVLTNYYALFAERVLNFGWFNVPNLVTVSIIETRNGMRPELHKQVSARCSKALRQACRMRGFDDSIVINRHNWFDVCRDLYLNGTFVKESPSGRGRTIDDLIRSHEEYESEVQREGVKRIQRRGNDLTGILSEEELERGRITRPEGSDGVVD